MRISPIGMYSLTMSQKDGFITADGFQQIFFLVFNSFKEFISSSENGMKEAPSLALYWQKAQQMPLPVPFCFGQMA